VALLVTGAMGHVGQEVVRHALAAGAIVIAQYRTTYRDSDVRDLQGKVKWVSCNLADPAAVAALCDAHPIDACIHSAAVSNDKYARPQPLTAISANVGATAYLLDMARRKNWRRFLFVSTGSVFQNATDPTKPIPEDTAPAVTNIYSTTKYCGELLTSMYRSQFGLSAAVVRISWVYGPPLVTDDPPRGPVPAFLRAALSGKPIRLASGADFAASFTYVADVAAGIKHAVKEGWAVSGRIALMGGSAGGLTVLNVAALHPDLVAAAIALYPVTDLLDLDATTHRCGGDTDVLHGVGEFVLDSFGHKAGQRVLADVPDHVGQFAGPVLTGRPPADGHGAGQRAAAEVRHQTVDGAQQGRLARPRLPDDDAQLALGNLEGHGLEREAWRLGIAKGHVVEADHATAASSSGR